MNAHPILHARDPERVRRALELMLPPRQARRLFRECEGSAARALELARTRGGRAWERFAAALAIHEQALFERAAKGPPLISPEATRRFLQRALGTLPYEVFCVLFVDNRHRLCGIVELFRGTIDGASVHPREVVREALSQNAAAVLFAHNHPSGVAEPSNADEIITARLKEALALVDVRVLDHVIVAGGACASCAENGLL